MLSKMDAWLSERLARWVAWIAPRAGRVAALLLALTVGFGVFAGLNLGVNSNNLDLVSEKLPSRINHAAFAELFPNLENALLVVVDGKTPELAREAADQLEIALREDGQRFTDAYQPGGGAFFERNGLLYRDVNELDEFADRMAAVQPMLAELERDGSIANLSRLVTTGLEAVRDGSEGAAPEEWPVVLDKVAGATVEVYSEYPIAISWDEVLLRGSALDATTRRMIVVHPILEFGSILSAKRAVDTIRDAATERGFTPERGVVVRVTGNPALNLEEMIGIAWDIGVGGVLCFFIVVGILYRALADWRVVLAAVITLLSGLVWSAAFAAGAVGHINIVSLSVAILFIGLGVDFAIHLGMRYSDLHRGGASIEEGLIEAARDVGASLVLCTGTTAIGFYVFVPTDYRGVAELGLIAGTSMIVIVFLTLTFFPALLCSWLRFEGASPASRELRFESNLGQSVARHARLVRWVALLLFLGGVAVIPMARFDPNVVKMRNPDTESVQAFDDLLADTGQSSPWYLDAIASDLPAARELATKLAELDEVDHAITIADYVPVEQEDKLDILADIAFLLDAPPASRAPKRDIPVDEQIASLRELHTFLSGAWIELDRSTLGASMRRLRDHLSSFLGKVEGADQATRREALATLEKVLLSNLPRQLGRLKNALTPEEIVLADLPDDLVRRMQSPDGRARVQIFPKEDLSDATKMREFAEAVQSVDPKASGIAINLVSFAEATQRSFQQALVSAAVLITIILYWLWRRVDDTLLVLAPLALSSVLSVAGMALIGLAFNFVNVIVIPLLFGIGVDSGIHLVHRSRELVPADEGLLGTTTARAVFYSAITTTISFGSLGLSGHRGMSSLGILLAIGMVLTVMSNLVVLPALIEMRNGGGEAAER